MIEGCEDQEDEKFPIYEEEEEMCDSVLIIEDNKGGNAFKNPYMINTWKKKQMLIQRKKSIYHQ